MREENDNMRSIYVNVPRRKVIEAYVRYDAAKKGIPLPDFAQWNWDDPDFLDNVLSQARFKPGMIVGFSEWNHVELTLDNLRNCAVVETIARETNGPRDLRGLETKGCLRDWKPKTNPSWFKRVQQGDVFAQCEPFILRRAVEDELPAKWYVEDGSGRATAIVANAAKYSGKPVVAYGFLGICPDRSSKFMNERPHYMKEPCLIGPCG